MEQVTCPNCNVDVEPEELKRNNLRCPTCGFDLSDAGDAQDLVADEDLEDEEEDDEEEEDEEDEDDEDEEE
jgi:Zn-finger nucleic acid-binding protein